MSVCPTCGRHDALLNLEKDESLRSFISTHFGAHLLNNSTGNTYNAMHPPSLHRNNKIKSEPNDNVLIPQNGVPYYDQSLPAYLIPGPHYQQYNKIYKFVRLEHGIQPKTIGGDDA